MTATEDWLGRWQDGRTGWHEAEGNAALHAHWPSLPAGSRVLVPLCGKSVDLLWLADRGLEVIGVELSPVAIEAFFTEQQLAYVKDESERLPAWRAVDRKLTLYAGDYFEFSCPPCAALFDRGALAAMPAARRPAYAAHTRTLLSDPAFQLLVTLEYEQERVAGPPFSIGADEVLSYWPLLQRISARNDIANAPPKFAAAGLAEFLEVAWRSP